MGAGRVRSAGSELASVVFGFDCFFDSGGPDSSYLGRFESKLPIHRHRGEIGPKLCAPPIGYQSFGTQLPSEPGCRIEQKVAIMSRMPMLLAVENCRQ